MWAWIFAVTVANAQSTGSNGIEYNPYYTLYQRAVANLGDITTPTTYESRIAPATVAFIDPTAGGGGTIAAIEGDEEGPHLFEALVVPDLGTFNSMNTGGFTIGYVKSIDDTWAGLEGHVATQPLGSLVAWLEVTNNSAPTQADISALPPLAEEDDYLLYAFQLGQGSFAVGWLLREEIHHEDETVGYIDRYYYLSNYRAAKKGVTTVVANPWGNFQTHQSFLQAIPTAQITRYQYTNEYSFETIGL